MARKACTVRDIVAMKEKRKITALTAYDYTMARLVSGAGINMILVGDSLAQCVRGEDTTLGVTVDEMIYHTKQVVRGNDGAMVIADLPFMSYQVSLEQGLANAGRVIKETGCNAVKLEGGTPERLSLIQACVRAGIPVMGHIGLTPQSVNVFGGYVVQGKSSEEGERLFNEAFGIEKAGAFSLVLECVPYGLAKKITRSLKIPTIGIGAGPYCDGQILVVNDMLGFTLWDKPPRFVKKYASLAQDISSAVSAYAEDVVSGIYPELSHSYKGASGEDG